MFSWLRRWIQANREWERAHTEAWSPYVASLPYRPTRLMDACMAQVREATGRTPQIVREIRIEAEQELALEVAVPGTDVTVFLHADTVQIESAARGELYWAEHWDYATPEAFLRAFRTALEKAAPPTEPAPANDSGTA